TLKPGKYKFGQYEFDFEPFYIGKGTDKRYISHLLNEDPINKEKNKIIIELKNKGIIPDIKIIKENLSNDQAYQLENNLINIIGRKDLGIGPLTNLTSGTNYKLEDISKIKFENLDYQKNKRILNVLNNSKTIKEASQKLNISERTLYRKMISLKIKKDKGNKYYFENKITSVI